MSVREAQEQRRLFEAVLESVSDGVVAVDSNKQFLVVNAAARKLFDASARPGQLLPEDWAPMHGALATDGAPLRSTDGILSRALRGESTDLLTFTMKRPGETRESWIEASGRPIADESGTTFAAVGVYRDVSQREHQATALLAAQSLLVRTGRLAEVGGWRLDLATQRSNWTEQIHRIFEVSPDVVPTMETSLGFYAPQSRPVIEAAIEHCVRTGEGWDLELPFVSAKGRHFWGRTQGEAEHHAGVVTHLVGALQDITSRKLAQLALRREQTFLESMLEHLPNTAVLVFKADGVIDRALGGPSLKRLASASEALIGRPIWDLGVAGREELESAARASLDGRATVLDVFRDGRRYEVHVLPLPSADSTDRDGVAIAYDVTDRDLLRSRLATHERLITMGALAAGVGHEINNPLAYLTSNLELVEEEVQAIAGASPSSRFRSILEMLSECREGAMRIRKIVQGLRSFAREPDVLGASDVHEALDVSIRMAMHEIRSRATLIQDLRPVPLVVGDDARLGQVFVNILANAGQAFGDRPMAQNHIYVSTWTDARGRAVIQIRDDGPGMTEEVAGRIFEPFYTTKPVGVGTGLGLAICQNVVAALGGEIVCESTLGEGTAFRVFLNPAKVDEASVDPPPPRTTVTSPRGRVLVVDDEVAVANVVSRTLGTQHDVVVYTEPVAALDALLHDEQDDPYDIILCDMTMPNLTGAELYSRLRTERPALADRVVFMTAGTLDVRLQHFLDTVRNEKVDKPFAITNLRALVWRFVAARTAKA